MKTVAEYQADIKANRNRITEITQRIEKLTADKDKMEKSFYKLTTTQYLKKLPKLEIIEDEILALNEERKEKEKEITKTSRLLSRLLNNLSGGEPIGW